MHYYLPKNVYLCTQKLTIVNHVRSDTEDTLYIMLYAVVTAVALIASCYLLFRLATCDWDARFGLVPWKSGMYDVSGFSVTNLSLRATKAIKITQTFELPLFGQLVANPASQHFYFVFGLTLKAI